MFLAKIHHDGGTIQYSAISFKEDKHDVLRASLKLSDQHVSSAA